MPALVLFKGHEDTLIWDNQASPIRDFQTSKVTIGENAVDFFNIEDGTVEIFLPTFTPIITETGFEISTTYTSTNLDYEGRHEWIPGMTGSESTQAVLIGESTYRELAGNSTVDAYTSPRWFFEVCDQTDDDCKLGLERLSAELLNVEGVSLALDWNTAHSDVERNGGLIFGTQGLLSLQFVVASMASVNFCIRISFPCVDPEKEGASNSPGHRREPLADNQVGPLRDSSHRRNEHGSGNSVGPRNRPVVQWVLRYLRLPLPDLPGVPGCRRSDIGLAMDGAGSRECHRLGERDCGAATRHQACFKFGSCSSVEG